MAFMKGRAVTVSNANRDALLQAFVSQQGAKGNWVACVAAFLDAVDNAVAVSSVSAARIIESCGQAHQFQVAMKVRALAYDAALSASKSKRRAHDVAIERAALRAAADCGRWSFAMRCCSGLVKAAESDVDRREAVERALSTSVKAGRWDVACHAFYRWRHAEGGEIDVSPAMLSTLVLGASQAGAWEVATKYFQGATRRGMNVTNDATNSLIRAMNAANRHANCVALTQQLCAKEGSEIALSTARAALESTEEVCGLDRSRTDVWRLACRLFVAVSGQQIALRRRDYESPFRACCASGEWKWALRMLHEQRKDGWTVSKHHFEQVLATKARDASGWSDAMKLLSGSSIINPNSTTAFNAQMAAAIRAREVGRAYAVRAAMAKREVHCDAHSYELRIELAFMQQKWAEVLREASSLCRILQESARLQKRSINVPEGIQTMIDAACGAMDPADPLVRAVRSLLNPGNLQLAR